MTTQTLFIGLDGCTFTVLDEMTRDLPGEGVTMPFLAGLLKNGARAKLRSTPNPLTPPAWASIMTGKGPGQHGVFDFIRAEDRGGEVYWTLYDCRDIDTETIWAIASRAGKKVAALNFPMTAPPPKNINGCIVPGFIPAKHLRRNTHPQDLFERMKQEIPGFDPKELAWDFEKEKQAMEMLTDSDMENWVRYHLPREEQWFNVAKYVLEHEKPDLMAVMFDGTDKIQHQAWKFVDPALVPKEPNEFQKRMREVCLQYFRNVDRYIKALVEMVGPQAQVFFASDHGFTACVEVLRINTFLAEKGYLKWAVNDGSVHALRREAADFANLDWAGTTAYCRTPSSNGIHIRVSEKPGDPGIQKKDYTRFREKLIEDLKSIRNDKGEPVVVDVLKRDEVFQGAHMKEAPDLTLVLRDNGFVSIRDLKPVVVPRPEPAGTHHPDGVFMAYGPGVGANGMVPRRKIVDVAATLLHSVGVAIPSDFEGVVAESFFATDWLGQHPVTEGEATHPVGERHKTEEMDATEKAQILEQLQMLGYME
jgi:predicted AlkP superfamily phosphohydrolase/phosphomutase